jgi:hypothetical protein
MRADRALLAVTHSTTLGVLPHMVVESARDLRGLAPG